MAKVLIHTDVKWTAESQREFNFYLKKLIETSTKTAAEVINRKMFFIALNSQKKTPKATRAEVERDLGIIGYKIRRSRKHGPRKLQRGARIMGRGNSNVYAIIQASRKKRGEKPLDKDELKRAVRRFVGARLRAIGSLKAGWSNALRFLAKHGTGSRGERGPRIKKQRSKAFAAKPTHENPKAKMIYHYTVTPKGKRKMIDPRVIKSLARAFRKEVSGMRQEMLRRMQTSADQINR